MSYDPDNDKEGKNTIATLTGGNIGDKLIRGAYMAARADAPDYSWMGAVGAGVGAFKAEKDAQRAIKETKRKESYADIDGIVDGIYEAGGSLPENYYNQAFDYAKGLREQYVAAVESGDTKEQHKIKGQLNAFATSIGTVKADLTTGAELWKDGNLINKKGFTDEQLNIMNSFGENNAILEEGVYKWINVSYDPTNPKSKEFYTMEDYKNAQPLRDDVTKEKYLKSNATIIENREKWRNGEGPDFDFKTSYEANDKLVTEENIQSMLWDDVSNQGSFAEKYLEENPDFKAIFDIMNKDEGGMSNMVSIGIYDSNGDGKVDYRDFIDPNTPEGVNFFKRYDTNKIPGLQKEEMQAIMDNPDSLKAMQDLAKIKMKSALTDVDNGSFDFNTSKRLVTDFMTRRQEQMFYGEDMKTYKTMVPGAENSLVRVKNGKLITLSDGEEISSIEDYVERGGSYSHLQKMGWKWSDKKKKFVNNANYKNQDWNKSTKKYNKEE